jgi:Leucine-rich repeat (LRR) protein
MRRLFGHDDDEEDSPFTLAEVAIAVWKQDFEDDPENAEEVLDLSDLGLTVIPPLPWGLQYLNCKNNQLETLGALPPTLLSLKCSNNKLTSLPENLPPFMTSLDCDHNALTSLPWVLPETLDILIIDHNQIHYLPPLPPNLMLLSAGENHLHKLPKLPGTLTSLYVSNNILTSVPKLHDGLLNLTLDRNLLTKFPEFPDSIQTLYICKNPAPGPLPRLPRALETLTACELGITSLPDPLPPKLQMIRVSCNKLTRIPTLPKTVTDVCFGHNYLTSLPLPLPPNLKILAAVWNRIGYLPKPEEMPKTIEQFWFDGNSVPNEAEDESMGDYIAYVERMFAKSKERITERTNVFFEEMMERLWHPDRLIQIIEKNGNSTQWNHELQAYVSGFDFTMMNEVL